MPARAVTESCLHTLRTHKANARTASEVIPVEYDIRHGGSGRKKRLCVYIARVEVSDVIYSKNGQK